METHRIENIDKMINIKKLTKELNIYRNAYYNENKSLISDYEYDKEYTKLEKLENEIGFSMSNSPTHNVGYEVKSKLEKVVHSHPMLSLDKTKSVDDLIKFSGGKDCIVSLKLDGLTILNTHDNGSLVQSKTRGNGEEGEIVTHNARVFDNLPNNIPFDGKFEIEGEAIITYSDFEKINAKLPEEDKFANPRNLASGSVRQLDSKIAKDRHVRFIAWKVPFGLTTFTLGFEIAESYGFEVVPYKKYNSNKDDINEIIEELKNIAKEKSIPIDGLVITYDNVEYGKSLGMTGHHPRHSLAYKFYDEEVETTLKNIDWTMGKTGQLTPTAVFEPVEIDGTIVERASLHNVSILKSLELSYGDTITVYKANQIIPQVKYNLDRTLDNICYPPCICPICGGKTEIVKDNDSEVLVCTNPGCKGKLLGKLSHAVSKNALNIDGLSESTLEKFINFGWIFSIKDVYHLSDYEKQMKSLEGFGKKSVDKLLESIEKSRHTTLQRILYAQSIPLVGKSATKDISKHCCDDIQAFVGLMDENYKFTCIDGFGSEMQKSLTNWWENNRDMFKKLMREFTFDSYTKISDVTQNTLQDKTFVITGKLQEFANRDALVEKIESLGGKVSGSVSAKTDYLINNDTESSSSKNMKAKKLNIPIISEEDFLKMIGE